jgi:integrase
MVRWNARQRTKRAPRLWDLVTFGERSLANAGHDTRALQAWLGHKNIQHTVRYTELAPDRFKNFWR